MKRAVVLAIILILTTGFAGCSRPRDNETAGQTPTESPVPGIPIPHIHGLAVDGVKSNRLYVATHGGVYVVENDRDWVPANDSFDVMGIVAHPVDSGVLFASGHPPQGGNIGLQKSTDGGTTWATFAIPGADFHSIAISPARPARMWGLWDGLIHRSEDSGKNWNSLPPHNTGGISSLAADATKPDTLYATTENGLHVSTDGGISWRKAFSIVGAMTSVGSSDAKPERIYFYSLQYGLHFNDNPDNRSLGVHQTSWKAAEGDYAVALAAVPDVSGVVYVGTSQGGLYKVVQGAGADWTSRTLRSPGNLIA